MPAARRAAVLGRPVDHSLSPVLHGAAYRALHLPDWTYERIDMDEAGLPAFVDGLGPEWAGLSVTMPGKRAALVHATEVTPRARAVGAANTLVPVAGGWRADCTDVDGVIGALRCAGGFTGGGRAVVIGAGGTAAAVVVAAAELGVSAVALVVREPARAVETTEAARRVGLDVEVLRWSDTDLAALAAGADLLVSTVPSEALTADLDALSDVPCVLDVIYHPWPTPLAGAVTARGGRIATGLDMLLHQAFGQVEQFTGHPAPRVAMRDALREATGGEVPLPLD
ncbi:MULTISPECIES: shikimate dehydrogenase [Prauserella salsuginis group]|uniref:Shikimate dehydrogenase n=1 Tax=Prauserella salsuginis TaxID=387889 RepID=A0ABW6GAJ8_9PSEU|nr:MULTISPECIES: shikimate dehydrogenase [Prauserella salsuginis group]MCR3723124.1 shikimate dehydrogenase [Prauserella flava]MCR3732501.1 shikimate dehydrogenase [Prauserella salsuginis]